MISLLKNIFSLRVWILAFLLGLSVSPEIFAQCKITTAVTTLCKGNSLTCTVNATAPGYLWNSGDGKTENKQTATFLYDHYGVFKLHVTLFNSDNTVRCKDSLNITVYDLPNASMAIGNSIEICYNKDYCFTNTSSMGANKAPIIQYLWLFGDGDLSAQKSPCHRYDRTSDYLIFLNVRDTNNCESKIEKKVHVIVGTSLSPFFIDTCTDSCPVTFARFYNLTDTIGKNIRKFIMDFDDGSKDSSLTLRDYTHTYKKDSTFIPSLTVISQNGCRQTFNSYRVIKNTVLDLKFNITAYPQTSCWPKNTIYFNQPPPARPIQYFIWEFGDSMSGSRNYNTQQWDPSHYYSTPGIYDISLHIEDAYCEKDTTLCNFVTILGPKAQINLPYLTNDCISTRVMPLSVFINASSNCLNPNGDSVDYTQLLKTSPYIRSSIDTYCNASIQSYTINRTKCGNDTNFKLKPSGTKKIWDTLSIYYDYWFPGDPLPVGAVYYPSTGSCNPQVMHDTDLYPLNCGAPNYVRFTNNSIKFRRYPALDDIPPFKPGSLGSDQCRNPSYPWASDSMQHLWFFDDDFGQNCTSTVANKNILCRYSTEVAPWHLYTKDGCSKVTLTVYDPVTKCTSSDSVIITMQKPDAGWDTSAYDYLNYRTQMMQPPLYPRRGLLVTGKPCVGEIQGIDLREVLPDCNFQDFGIVFDSVEDCVLICSDTTILDLHNDGIMDTFLTYKKNCSWHFKSSFPIFKDWVCDVAHSYPTPGCKTVGMWIKSGDCYDTFWYHDYKFITTMDPAFNLLDYDSLKPVTLTNVCAPFRPAMTVKVKNQQEIISFRYEILKYGSGNILYRGYCTKVKDTVYVMAEKSSPKDTFLYPAQACPADPLNNKSLTDLLKQFYIKDTIYTLSLEDTVKANYTITEPGKYQIRSIIVNANGCDQSSIITIGVGFYEGFSSFDSVLCLNDTTYFHDSVLFHNSGWHPLKIDLDFNDDGAFDTSTFYKYPQNWQCGSYIPYFGYGQHDTGLLFKYTKPGIFTVRMRVYDSVCKVTQVFEKKHYIYVGGVKSDFDTTNSPSNCAPQVVGFEDRSKLLTPYYYKYDSAGNIIDSFNADFLVSWLWNFGDNKGPHSISMKRNPSHAYTANGDFDVKQIVTTALGCIDSIDKPRYIVIDGPRPGYNLLDTFGCVPFTARFIDTSKRVSGWIWQLGDNTQSSGVFNYGDTVPLVYNRAGVFYPTLVGSDSVYNVHLNTYTKCTSIFPDPYNPYAYKYKVTVLPINPLKFTGDTILCTGQKAYFTDQSDTSYDKILWDFGDSNNTQSPQGVQISHVYEIPEDEILGKYNVFITGEGAVCPDKPNMKVVTVKRVIADILWDSSLNTDPVFCFRNYTKGGTKYDWVFKGGNPSFTKVNDTNYRCTNYYTDTGIKTVCMKAVNEIGCKDEVCVDVVNHYDVLIIIPNIFTPGSSLNVNDTFTITSKNIEMYNLTIYNRWGDVVYISNEPDKHWDGNDYEKGMPCSPGTYYFVLNYKFKHLDPKTAVGTVTLVR